MKHIKKFNENKDMEWFGSEEDSILSTQFGGANFEDLQEDLAEIDDNDRMKIIDHVEELTNLISDCVDKELVIKSLAVYFMRLHERKRGHEKDFYL